MLVVVFEAGEALGADGAAETVVVGVRALVLEHVCTSTEALLTELALKRLNAYTHTHTRPISTQKPFTS